ncbi:hypothetical protein QTO34_014413 [Cnephaeus nilssonii]|uniref:Beta-adaptin appendage C-terminal subdomain domain-containing protein n=1 Tax=Cnephaeus nilssonii TaxID=3371016 RepID=A0AA40LUA2_CNENI|nr:hypothetical protein QTO34_014413 [Eptesicus nilssonii]
MNRNNINKLLIALNECTEWGLHCLSDYNPKEDREAQSIREWVTAGYLNQLSSGAVSSKSPNEISRVVTQRLCLWPSETQELVQQVLSLATRETNVEPTLLGERICHCGSLATVYHKPPNAFVKGSHGIHRQHLPIHHGSTDAGDSPLGTTTATNLEQPQVILSQGDLLGDLLNLYLGPPVNLNKNSFGVVPSTPLAIHPHWCQTRASQHLGPVMKMEPLNNLQVAVKDNINVFYFSHLTPLNVHFVEDGKMESQVFLAAWKDIPNENQLQLQIKECHLKADVISSKLQNNIYTIAKGNMEGHAVLTAFGSWPSYVTSQEIPIRYNLSPKCRAPEVSHYIYQV